MIPMSPVPSQRIASSATALHRVRGFVPQTLLAAGIFSVFALAGPWIQIVGGIVFTLLD